MLIPMNLRTTPTFRFACLIAVLAGAILPSGCSDTIYYTKVTEPPRPLAPRDPASVETYTLTPPARPHTAIGIFQVQQGAHPGEDPIKLMMSELRAHAATEGCDAILISSIDRTSGRYHSPSIQAGCLIYTGPPPAGGH